MHFTPQELWAATGTPVRIVLLIMMLMAVWCIYVAVERTIALAKARKPCLPPRLSPDRSQRPTRVRHSPSAKRKSSRTPTLDTCWSAG